VTQKMVNLSVVIRNFTFVVSLIGVLLTGVWGASKAYATLEEVRERCHDNEAVITVLKEDQGKMKADIRVIRTDVDWIKDSNARIEASLKEIKEK